MLLIAAVLVGSVALGYAVGGRLLNLAQVRVRLWWLAVVALALQVAPLPKSWSADAGFAVLEASFLLLIVFGLANIRLAGFALILIGVLMNVLVVSLNRGMPVTRHALVASHQEDSLRELERGGTKHHLAGPGDRLLPLADVIAIGRPVNQIVSAGDLVTYAGVAWFLVRAMRRGSRAARARGAHRPGSRPTAPLGQAPPRTRARPSGTGP